MSGERAASAGSPPQARPDPRRRSPRRTPSLRGRAVPPSTSSAWLASKIDRCGISVFPRLSRGGNRRDGTAVLNCPASRHMTTDRAKAARDLLAFYMEAGVDALVGEAPVDHFAPEVAPPATTVSAIRLSRARHRARRNGARSRSPQAMPAIGGEPSSRAASARRRRDGGARRRPKRRQPRGAARHPRKLRGLRAAQDRQATRVRRRQPAGAA